MTVGIMTIEHCHSSCFSCRIHISGDCQHRNRQALPKQLLHMQHSHLKRLSASSVRFMCGSHGSGRRRTWLNTLGELIRTVDDPLHIGKSVAQEAEPAQYLANTSDNMGLQLAPWQEQGYPAACMSKRMSAM